MSEVSANPDLQEGDVDVMRAMSDGGRETDVEELAASSGRSRRTIYRAYRRLESVVLGGGRIRFASEFIKSIVPQALAGVRNWSSTTMASTTPTSHRFRDGVRYGATVEERGRTPRLTVRAAMSRLRSSSAPSLAAVLGEGLAAWKDSGRDGQRFEDALVTCRGSTRSGTPRFSFGLLSDSG